LWHFKEIFRRIKQIKGNEKTENLKRERKFWSLLPNHHWDIEIDPFCQSSEDINSAYQRHPPATQAPSSDAQ